jgi:hypothetical protein
MAEPVPDANIQRNRARPRETGKRIIGRYARRTFAGIVLATGVCYACDYLVLRYRVATNHQPFGTVTVRPYYAVPRKDHKTEFLFDDPTDETCVHSLFPHMGDSPCWYLSRNRDQRIDM